MQSIRILARVSRPPTPPFCGRFAQISLYYTSIVKSFGDIFIGLQVTNNQPTKIIRHVFSFGFTCILVVHGP